MTKLILASKSPRRLQLLNSTNIIPDIVDPPNINESIIQEEKPKIYLKRICLEKAKSIQKKYENDIILAADTIVSTKQKIFLKPKDEKDAKKTLKYLSGRNHSVITGVYACFKDT